MGLRRTQSIPDTISLKGNSTNTKLYNRVCLRDNIYYVPGTSMFIIAEILKATYKVILFSVFTGEKAK